MGASAPAGARELFDKEIRGYSIDSRTVGEGELFFALSPDDYARHGFTGTHFTDAHLFIPDALARGAVAAVALSGRVAGDATLEAVADRLLLTGDCIDALQVLAQRVLAGWGRPVVGITGSAGKTTTKDLTAHLLAASGRRVLRSKKNYNNELGLPLSILQMVSEGAAVLSASAISPGPTRKTVATAAAASAFIRLCRPGIGSSAGASPSGVRRRKRVRPSPAFSMSAAVTSAGRSMPNVSVGPVVWRARIAATRSSSALRTAVPPGLMPATSCAFASAIASTVPKNSRWTGATRSSTPTSGGTISTSRAISFGVDIPISRTATSKSSGEASSETI